jgi:class 3 adenylate cyclase
MAALGLLVLDIQRKGLSRAEKELESALVDEAASSVVAAFEEANDVASRVSTVFADEKIDVDARARLIGDIVSHAPSTSGIAFFDENKKFVDAVVPKGGPDAELRVPPAGARGWAGFRYEAPLSGPVRGWVVVAVSRAAIEAKLRDLSQVRFGAPDRLYLVDESARGRHPIFASVPLASTEVVMTTEFTDGGVAKVGTIRTMPAQHLALVVERPTDEAFAALAEARRWLVLSIAGATALIALLAATLFGRVVERIGALMRLVSRYGRRDLRARSDVKSGDELEDLGHALEKMADDLTASDAEIAKRARIEENLKRYLPDEAAKAAASDDGTLALGGAKKRVTVLFADVVAFTGFAERASPEKAVAFLNELFTILSEIVFRHDGMVDKFIGDCIMAVFQGDDATARSLAAAEDMHAFVESNLPRWREAYAFDVKLGIGVASGDVLLGNLGSSTRMEYTVIGDAVNVAARLEMLARPSQTLATKEVVNACPDVGFKSLGEHALRGKASPVEVFEVLT